MATQTALEAVTELSEYDKERVATEMASAFAMSPIWVWVFGFGFGEGEERARTWRAFFKAFVNLALAAPGSAFHVIRDEQGEIVGSFTLSDAKQPPGLLDKVRAGLLLLPFRIGFGAMRRLLALGQVMDERLGRIADDRETVYLERMIISPKLQGQGVGTKHLAAALDKVAASGRVCVLATQEARNVVFYERLGFRIVDDQLCDLCKTRSWYMERPAENPSSCTAASET